MYPWYRGSTGKDFDLRADDVQGVRALYGELLTQISFTEFSHLFDLQGVSWCGVISK